MERNLSPLNDCEKQPRSNLRNIVSNVKLTDDCTKAVKTLQRADPPSLLKCAYHNFGSHISSCRKFGLLFLWRPSSIFFENHLCFKCLGKHQIKSCAAQPKCSLGSGHIWTSCTVRGTSLRVIIDLFVLWLISSDYIFVLVVSFM